MMNNLLKYFFKSSFIVLLCLPWTAHAKGELTEPHPQEERITPWFTGPLIAPTASVIPAGHFVIQPFFAFNTSTGIYNSHWQNRSAPNFFSYSTSLELIVGLTEWMDFEIQPAVLYNYTKHESAWAFGDFPFNLSFQLLPVGRFEYFPGIELQIVETFPTGKYQKSNPKKLTTDLGGAGSFATTANLNFYKIYSLQGVHFLSMTASFGVTYHAPVHVRGINFYGGAPGCAGKVYPGNSYNALLSFEYSLTRNWALALDNLYTHFNKDRFRGTAPAKVGKPSSELLSFAPAVEYNFNEQWGIIAGVWLSAIGRNTAVFRIAIISFEYQY